MHPIHLDARIDVALLAAQTHFTARTGMVFNSQYFFDFKNAWMGIDRYSTGVFLNVHCCTLLAQLLAAKGWDDWSHVSDVERANQTACLVTQGCISCEQLLLISENRNFRPPASLPPDLRLAVIAAAAAAAAAAAVTTTNASATIASNTQALSFFGVGPAAAAAALSRPSESHQLHAAAQQNDEEQGKEHSAQRQKGTTVFEYIDAERNTTVIVRRGPPSEDNNHGNNNTTTSNQQEQQPEEFILSHSSSRNAQENVDPVVVPGGKQNSQLHAIVRYVDNIKIAVLNNSGNVRHDIHSAPAPPEAGEGLLRVADDFCEDSDNQLSLISLANAVGLQQQSDLKLGLEIRLAALRHCLNDDDDDDDDAGVFAY